MSTSKLPKQPPAQGTVNFVFEFRTSDNSRVEYCGTAEEEAAFEICRILMEVKKS